MFELAILGRALITVFVAIYQALPVPNSSHVLISVHYERNFNIIVQSLEYTYYTASLLPRQCVSNQYRLDFFGLGRLIDLLRAQLGISGIDCWATGVTMRAESSILELVETAN